MRDYYRFRMSLLQGASTTSRQGERISSAAALYGFPYIVISTASIAVGEGTPGLGFAFGLSFFIAALFWFLGIMHDDYPKTSKIMIGIYGVALAVLGAAIIVGVAVDTQEFSDIVFGFAILVYSALMIRVTYARSSTSNGSRS